jgi:eukaryotic-like serine/threonine-protein kinase
MAQAAVHAAAPQLALGRYRPLHPLGTGGSGSVWLAVDERTGLEIALKVVPLEGKAEARAEREAEAAARLRHPGCLRAYAFGRERGHVYIAYEYARGRTFRELLRGGELSDADALEACAQIAEALAHAHSRGVLHRDVKPANVMLLEGRDVSVRLLDFGLAAFDGAETLTAQGDVPGTLAYISPERLAGEPATSAADVWAVGVMLWEALAGRHPFVRASLLQTGEAIEAGAPSLATRRPDLPQPVIEAVDRALALDPRKRPTAARLAHALRAARPERASRTLPPGRLAIGALAGTFAGVTTALIPFWPAPFAFAFAALAGALAFVRPRLGAVAAAAVPVFPLGNLALGLALAYGTLAPVWLALARFRGVVAATGVLFGYVLMRPLDVLVAREESPLAAAQLVAAAVPTEALRLAAAVGLAVTAVPLVRTPWRIAVWGAATLSALLLPNPELAAWPAIALVWAACCGLALRRAT